MKNNEPSWNKELMELLHEFDCATGFVTDESQPHTQKNLAVNRIVSFVSRLSEKERLIKEVEGMKWTPENAPISKMELELNGIAFTQGKVEGHNQLCEDILRRLQSV